MNTFRWLYLHTIPIFTQDITDYMIHIYYIPTSPSFPQYWDIYGALCVGRCTTRNKLNKGVTWSISLNLWSICIYASKTKSICEPFFDWIKITDFFIVKLTIFWEWKMTPKNSQFCYKKSVILIQSKKGSHIDFVFDA